MGNEENKQIPQEDRANNFDSEVRQNIIDSTNPNTQNSGKSLTSKEIHKLNKKKQKQNEREAMLQQRKLKEEKLLIKETAEMLKESSRLNKEKAAIEHFNRAEEIKRIQEDELFSKHSANFEITQEGSNKSNLNIDDFIQYIILRKVVDIEETSATFNLASVKVIELIRKLEEENVINGILDDRGRYILLSDSELEVYKLIRLKYYRE